MADTQIANSLKYLEEHIEALESRNAFQDDVIEQLSHELSVHQAEISELKLQLKMIAERFKNQQNFGLMKPEDEPPPPHY